MAITSITGMFGSILVFGAFILCTMMAVGLGIAFMKAILGGGSTKRLRHLDNQETREFQELEHGFRRMEERLDALETLLIGPQKSSIPERERDPEFDV
jgi:hypothetical protein